MFEYRETQNIRPIPLGSKECLFQDLLNIENSWTGRVDAMFANTFIQEAVQLITNAIILFEKGYFDASFYSIRQSLEISTTIVYFVDDRDENQKDTLTKWKSGGKFPMHKKMVTELEKRNTVFADMLRKMKSYFDEIDAVKRQLNKYVHKQGFDKYYVRVNNPVHQQKYDTKIINDFNYFIEKAIGAIAVHRLAIDPYPVLLEDEQIYKRTGQLMTEGYDSNFIDKYIGPCHIMAYKETKVYRGYYDEIIKKEEMTPPVVNLVKYNYVDRSKIPEIIEQLHLLGFYERVVVNLFALSEKIASIYTIGGFDWYSSDIESNRTRLNWSSETFNAFKDGDGQYNRIWDEVFLSCITTYKEDFYIEHNSAFTPTEISMLEQVRLEYDKKLSEIFDPLEKS